MATHLILVRGINVGGLNRVPMAGFKTCLQELGFKNVSTFLVTGNALIESDLGAREIEAKIDDVLPKAFRLDSELVRVLALTRAQFKAMVDKRPKGFGDQPDKYHSDAIFLMGLTTAQAMKVFSPREGVDMIWPGKGVIYSQRLSAMRTKSRLNRIMAAPEYHSMTIRSWSTTTKLLELMSA